MTHLFPNLLLVAALVAFIAAAVWASRISERRVARSAARAVIWGRDSAGVWHVGRIQYGASMVTRCQGRDRTLFAVHQWWLGRSPPPNACAWCLVLLQSQRPEDSENAAS
jgi:hypothetical protein